jgi:hypothetical protein
VKTLATNKKKTFQAKSLAGCIDQAFNSKETQHQLFDGRGLYNSGKDVLAMDLQDQLLMVDANAIYIYFKKTSALAKINGSKLDTAVDVNNEERRALIPIVNNIISQINRK